MRSLVPLALSLAVACGAPAAPAIPVDRGATQAAAQTGSEISLEVRGLI